MPTAALSVTGYTFLCVLRGWLTRCFYIFVADFIVYAILKEEHNIISVTQLAATGTGTGTHVEGMT